MRSRLLNLLSGLAAPTDWSVGRFRGRGISCSPQSSIGFINRDQQSIEARGVIDWKRSREITPECRQVPLGQQTNCDDRPIV